MMHHNGARESCLQAGYQRYPRHEALHIFVVGERKGSKFFHRNLHRVTQYNDEVDGSLYRKQNKKKKQKT